jgi:hypothetical protein
MPIQRIVCFKFIEGVSEEAIGQHLQDFAGLKTAIPQIQEYRAGLTRPGDNNRPADYDVMHYMTFDSMEAIDVYIPHPAHQAFVARNRASWNGVLVLNSEIEG